MDATLWISILNLCQVTNNYYSKTNSKSSKPGSGRLCSSQKLRHKSHCCHSSGFQKYEGKCGKSYLQTLKYAPVDYNSVNHPFNTQMTEIKYRYAKSIYLLFCIIPNKSENNSSKFRKSVLVGVLVWVTRS